MKARPIPRPDYPRPQMVRDEWLNLNGVWEFELDPGLSGEDRHLAAGGEALSRSILVPFAPESELSGLGHRDFMPCVWYRRAFALPSGWQNGRVLLHFGAVDYEAKVWVNGRPAGSHRGGYSSFSFDITDLLRAGENIIVVRAFDDTRSGLQPAGKQSVTYDSKGIFYTRTTGIWQTVWLEPVPHTHLQGFRLYPDLDGGKVMVHARVAGDTAGLVLKAHARAGGRLVGEAEASAHSSTLFSLGLSEVHAWGPGEPFLYDLEFTLARGAEQLDQVRSYVGLRKVHIEGKRVLVNNRPLFQRLVLDQGFYPQGIYTPETEDIFRSDIELAMAMGFNGARLHQRVFEPRFLYWADRLGYLCWGEYANYGLDHAHPSALERVLEEWLAVLDRDFSHPCLIGWCPFNETYPGQNAELLRSIYRVTKAVDPTRPVIDTSGYVHVETDIYDCHAYEGDPAKFAALFEPFKTSDQICQNHPDHDARYQGQPYFVSEYGGIWWNPGQADDQAWGYGDRPGTQEEFLARYRSLTEALLFHPKIAGFCYTQLCDVEQEVNGLLDHNHRPKLDPAVMREINAQQAAIESE